MYHVIFENQGYRVIDYHLKAGEKEPMHSHPVHRGENIGLTEAHSLLVEPKSRFE
jgi:hypothetical protein